MLDKLYRCTLMIKNQVISLDNIKKLSYEYPFIEWGVNIYHNASNPEQKLLKLVEVAYYTGSTVSIHFNQKQSINLLSLKEDSLEFNLIKKLLISHRVKLNIKQKTNGLENKLKKLCEQFPNIQFITPYNQNSVVLINNKIINHQIIWEDLKETEKELRREQYAINNKINGFNYFFEKDNIEDYILKIKHLNLNIFWLEIHFSNNKITFNDYEDLLKKIILVN